MNQTNIEAFGSVTPKPRKEDFAMHTHDCHEIFYFLSGDADYAVEGSLYPLRSGDMLLMRKSEAHYLIPRSPARYERIVVNFDPRLLYETDPSGGLSAAFEDRALGKFNRFEAKLFPDNHWLFFLRRICESDSQWKKKIYLLALMDELSGEFEKVKTQSEHSPAGRSAQVIAYINEHLFEPLSLEELASLFYLSRSQLNRSFKRDTGSTVYHYITVKRLFEAHKRIREGTPPTRVFEACGFGDYISFYKAYKKQFGCSPKSDYGKTDPADLVFFSH